ncbi:MAG: hypothetical protein AB8G77_11830 [Rhodothermales bacterium]
MKTIHKTISIFLTGLFLLLGSTQLVKAQDVQQPVDAGTLVRSEQPDTLLGVLNKASADSLIATLTPDEADRLLSNLIQGQSALSANVSNFSKEVESFSVGDSSNVSFEYIDVRNRNSLLQLAASMTDSRDYPVVVFKKAVFIPGMEILRTLDLQIKNYEHRDGQWQTLDSIHKAKYQQLQNIVDLQGQRVANYKAANTQLNEQINQLDKQLTSAVELTEKSLKGRTRRNLWIGTLGGVFGFSLGVLISAL